MSEAELEARAELFKALGHPTRLLIISLIERQPRHGEELAAILNLKPATISHHLALLAKVGLLQATKDQYYQTYALAKGMLDQNLRELALLPQPGLTTAVEEDAYRNTVLKTFLVRGQLKQIPAQLKKRRIIMERLVEAFEPGQQYTEHEVNQLLLEFHEDVATLRRELISMGLMQREQGIYWRVLAE